MNVKQIIKWFEDNKIEHLEKAQKTISVGTPSLGCDLNEMVKEDDERMNAVSYFLYYYQLMEMNIKNYKNYSKPSNYDEETIKMIEEQMLSNHEQYNNTLEHMSNINNS